MLGEWVAVHQTWETEIPLWWNEFHHIPLKGSARIWNLCLLTSEIRSSAWHWEIASHHVTAFLYSTNLYWIPICQMLCWESVMQKTESLPSRHQRPSPGPKPCWPPSIPASVPPIHSSGHHSEWLLGLKCPKSHDLLGIMYTLLVYHCGNPSRI